MKKTLSVILTFVLLASLLAGCGASTMGDAEYAPMEDSKNAISSDSAVMDNYYGVGSDESFAESAESESGSESDTDLYLDSQKLIYSCNIEMETLKFADTVAEIKAMIAEYEGFIESDSMSDDSWNWYYAEYKKNGGTLSEMIVARIPTKNYNDFVNGLDGSGKIMSKSEKVTNITKSYNDTSTTIEMLEKEEEMLLAMMDQCKTIDEMLSVESRLSTVQQKLAIYRSNLGDMDMDIAFSTVTIRIREVMEYTRVVAEELKFVERFVEAVEDSCEEFTDVVEDLIIFMVYAAPYAVIAIVIVVVVTVSTKHKKEKAKKAVEAEMNEKNLDKQKTEKSSEKKKK